MQSLYTQDEWWDRIVVGSEDGVAGLADSTNAKTHDVGDSSNGKVQLGSFNIFVEFGRLPGHVRHNNITLNPGSMRLGADAEWLCGSGQHYELFVNGDRSYLALAVQQLQKNSVYKLEMPENCFFAENDEESPLLESKRGSKGSFVRFVFWKVVELVLVGCVSDAV